MGRQIDEDQNPFQRGCDVTGRRSGILGRAGVNIGGFQLGRSRGDHSAVSIINVDQPVPADALDEIRAIEEVLVVRSVVI